MNHKLKTNLKIAGATMTCILSLASCFAMTYAWFASNQTVTATGMNIRIKVDDSELSQLTVHRCDLSNSTKTVLKFDSTPSVIVSGQGSIVEASGVQMDNYSILNQTQPVLLLFSFSEEVYEDDLTITATTQNASFTSSLTEQNVANFPFSSVVTFKCVSYSTDSFPFNNVSLVDNNEDPVYTASSFVTINGTGQQATYTYTANPTLFTGSKHTRITHLAVILDYYSAAIEYIKGHTNNYASVVLTNSNVINYFCDWMLEM